MSTPKRILLIRLSALGDVAILEPVIRQRAASNPGVQFFLAAPPMLAPLFEGISNLTYIPTKKLSSAKLYAQLRSVNPDMVADMHSVWRTWGLRLLFALRGVPSKGIDKERRKRKAIFKHKDGRPIPELTPSWRRYDRLLARIGLEGETEIKPQECCSKNIEELLSIGVAPFAQHKGKIYPIEKMENVVDLLSLNPRIGRITLFGSKSESEILATWEARYPKVQNIAGKLPFEQELKVIENLDIMLTMDSANMHFASCKGVRVVSVWGATHPAAGFYGFEQDRADAVMLPMPCRPCSMFGKKPCQFGDYRCLAQIDPETIVEAILRK